MTKDEQICAVLNRTRTPLPMLPMPTTNRELLPFAIGAALGMLVVLPFVLFVVLPWVRAL
jgi:hypothetical protein